MRLLAHSLLLLSLCSASCTYISHPTAGKYASLGGDTMGHNQNATGFSFASNNNSAAFVKLMDTIEKMWQNYLVAEGLKFALGKYYTHEGKVVDAATTVKLEELRNAASVAEAEHALEALKLTKPL